VKNEGGACNCEVKFSHAIEEYKDQLESKHKEDKARAIKELEERVSIIIIISQNQPPMSFF